MPGPFVRLPSDATPITDADEEIFLVYTGLNRARTKLTGPDGYHGLGHVDSRKDVLTIRFELSEDATETQQPCIPQPKSKQKRLTEKQSIDIEIDIAQDKTALRSRKGDAGSVVWRASVEFCRAVLHSGVFYRTCSPHAGTGLLGIALSPLFRAYTATDIPALLPLIRKNVAVKPPMNLSVEELDWLTLTSLPPGPTRTRYCPYPRANSTPSEVDVWDLILVVDCIYHPSLLRPLVETIETLSHPGRTWVFVVVELRQEDVIREFLNLWLTAGDWVITRIDGFLDENYAVWAGHRSPPASTM
ncbi:hypothetical protein EDC04DRAFT_2877704 [Pisolithus marmoratus]|nr:hypothetical protein EDC04DRAFT_2877704 [Pisolithus marmoratus]